MKIDYDQGRDDNGETFGFIYLEEGKGGWFFTYKKTLRATLKTLEYCSVEGDGGIDEEDARDFLKKELSESVIFQD